MSPLTFDLDQLLAALKAQLQEWSADGLLVSAAREALVLSEVPQELERLASQWTLGDFSGLPLIEVLEGSMLPGAAGAYAISTGTIYLNKDWLALASVDQFISVLSEELGHHLDGLLNAADTPGDEGKAFSVMLVERNSYTDYAQSLLITPNEYDDGYADIDNDIIGLEYSSNQVEIITKRILSEHPFGVIEISLDFARDITTNLPLDPSVDLPLDPDTGLPIVDYIDYEYISQWANVVSKSVQIAQIATDLYTDYGNGGDLENNYYQASDTYINLLKNLFEVGMVKSFQIIVPPVPIIGDVLKIYIEDSLSPLLDSVNIFLDRTNSYLNQRLVMDALISGAFSAETGELANTYVRGGINKTQLDDLLAERGLYERFVLELSSFQQGLPPLASGGVTSEVLIDIQNRIRFRQGVQRLFKDTNSALNADLLLDGATVTGSLGSTLVWISGHVRNLTVESNGSLVIRRNESKTISEGFFRNLGIVDVEEGGLSFSSDQRHTGIFVAQQGTISLSSGRHELTTLLTIQGEKTSLRGPTNDPSSYLTGVLTNLNILNWDYGVINDFTIDIGSQLLLTDLAAMPPKIFTGQIHNKGRVAYTDVVNGLYNDGWSPLIFGLGDRAAYVTNDGTFEISGPFSSLRSSSPHPYSIPRSVGSKFINNGIFRRAGSGSSLIEVDFENNGRLELAEGDLYIYNSHFRNHGVVDIALGRTALFDSNQVYTGTFVVDKGNLQIYGGKHEFTDQLILQGEKTYLRGPTNDPSSYLTGVLTNSNILNWDYGVINDFTIDIGSQLLLTDLAAMPPKIFTGQIHNKGRVAYTDVVNGLYNDGWSPLIFGLGDRAAYVTNDGTFEISGPFSSLRSSSPHPYSIPRSVGSKFINNGILTWTPETGPG